MPARYIRCPVSTRLHTFSDCLSCAAEYRGQENPKTGKVEQCDFDYPYLHYLFTQADGRRDAGVSATMLNSCLRASWWDVHRDYEIEPQKQMPAANGTAWHDLMDRHLQPNTYGERRLTLTHPLPSGRNFTGKFDRLLPVPKAHRTQPNGVHEWWIQDYKRKEDDHLFRFPPDYYALQLNIYRFMIERGATDIETGEYFGGKVTRLTLLPSSHKEQGKRVDVPLWPLEPLEAYLEECLALWDAATTASPPPPHREPTQDFFCRTYCAHYQACRQLGGEPYDPKARLYERIAENARTA